LVAKLTSLRTTPWLKIVASIFRKIFNVLLSNESFLPFWFSVQNSLFYGYVHGSSITISSKGIQFLSENSKLNGGIPLQQSVKVQN
jgi:hypothetical protein